jgi:hypothetical protein
MQRVKVFAIAQDELGGRTVAHRWRLLRLAKEERGELGTIAFLLAPALHGTSAMATERNSRSKSVLAHQWLATAGLGIALGRHRTRTV